MNFASSSSSFFCHKINVNYIKSLVKYKAESGTKFFSFLFQVGKKTLFSKTLKQFCKIPLKISLKTSAL